MRSTPGFLGLIRLLALFTVLGFLVITVGPVVLGIVVAVLPFALVGFGIWLVFHTVRHGHEAVGARARDLGQALHEQAQRVVRTPARVCAGACNIARQTGYRVGRLVRAVVGILSPIVGGAVVGGFLGAAGGMHYHDMAVRIPAGMLIGALIGVAAGFLWRRAEPEAIVLERADKPAV